MYTIELLNIKQQNNNLEQVTEFCQQKSSKLELLLAAKSSQFNNQIIIIQDFIQETEAFMQKIVENQARKSGVLKKMNSDVNKGHQNEMDIEQMKKFTSTRLVDQDMVNLDDALDNKEERKKAETLPSQDALLMKLEKFKEILLEQVEKLHKSFNVFTNKSFESIQNTLKEL